MRLLILTNFFPPARSGGYTQWCHEVATRLAERGHTIGVLTSSHERAKVPAGDQNIYRLLHLDGDLVYYQPLHFFTRWRHEHRENLMALDQVVQTFAPDLLFVWGMWAVAKAVPARAEHLLPGRVVYYLSDYWPAATDMHTTYWRLPPRHALMRPAKQLLGKLAFRIIAEEGQPELQLQHAICVSARVRELLVEAGLPVQNARIIHGGTDVERFRSVRQWNGSSAPLRLLYAGQLVQHKGVHTAIEAMSRLVKRWGADQVHLTVVGSGHPAYEAFLHNLVKQEGLDHHVTFQKSVAKEEMPTLFERFDLLILPSIYEEPLARVPQEAMAAGLVVVGTTTGGTPEILRDGETGLTFAPEDSEALAEQISRLIADPDLRFRLMQAGHQMIIENFTLRGMVDEIESYLLDRCAHAQDPR